MNKANREPIAEFILEGGNPSQIALGRSGTYSIDQFNKVVVEIDATSTNTSTGAGGGFLENGTGGDIIAGILPVGFRPKRAKRRALSFWGSSYGRISGGVYIETNGTVNICLPSIVPSEITALHYCGAEISYYIAQ